jgi:hypothetical protein
MIEFGQLYLVTVLNLDQPFQLVAKVYLLLSLCVLSAFNYVLAVCYFSASAVLQDWLGGVENQARDC